MKLSILMNYDTRCTPKHKIVWEFHLGWAHKDHGWTSLASVRTIRDVLTSRSPTGKALSARHISAANRDLCAWGYITEIQKGSGRWASRFTINWELLEFAAKGEFPISVPHEGNANLALPLGGTQDAGRGYANDSLCIPHGVQRPNYLDPAKDGDIGSGSVSPSPAAAGLSATAPAGGFEAAWKAYGKLGNKQLARAAWEAIAPDADQMARIIERAASWAASAKPGQRRMVFQKWLSAEKWDEADRAISQKPVPAGARRRTIVYTNVGSPDDNGKTPVWSHYLDHDEDEDGPRDACSYCSYETLARIQRAAGAKDIIGKTADVFQWPDGGYEYAPANDNAQHRAAS